MCVCVCVVYTFINLYVIINFLFASWIFQKEQSKFQVAVDYDRLERKYRPTVQTALTKIVKNTEQC